MRDEWDDTDWEEDDWPDDDDETTDVVRCPECGAEVYEDAVSCPHCGHYITHGGGGPLEGRPMWWVALGILGVIAVIAVLSGAFAWLLG